MKSMRERIQEESIQFDIIQVHSNPNMDNDYEMDNFSVKITYKNREFITGYSTGIGRRKYSNGVYRIVKPKPEDILACLASDCSMVDDCPAFEDFADELGYDTDSGKAEKIYNVCKEQRDKLFELFGEELYENLVWKTERLYPI